MSGRTRDNSLSPNFDSLTDTITNLTGAMLLIVVIVLGVSLADQDGERGRQGAATGGLSQQAEQIRAEIRALDRQLSGWEQELPGWRKRADRLREAPGATPRPPVPDSPAPVPPGTGPRIAAAGLGGRETWMSGSHWGPAANTLSSQSGIAGFSLPWLLFAGLLTAPDASAGAESSAAKSSTEAGHFHSLADVAGLLDSLAKRIPPVGEELDRLIQEVLEAPRPAPCPTNPPPPSSEEILFRPPVEHYVAKQAVFFCCHEGGLHYLDAGYMQGQIDRLQAAWAGRTVAREETHTFDLPDSGLCCQVTIRQYSRFESIERLIRRKPGAQGESLERLSQDGSKYLRVLDAASTQKCVLVFAVYPDSLDVFLAARRIARQRGYEIGWVPFDYGTDMRIAGGRVKAEG